MHFKNIVFRRVIWLEHKNRNKVLKAAQVNNTPLQEARVTKAQAVAALKALKTKVHYVLKAIANQVMIKIANQLKR
jgi:hypothetical protein